MSNPTQDSRDPGQPKRRRSRGGRNRNRNRSQEGGERQHREPRERSNHSGPPQGAKRHPQGRQDTRPARKYLPPKLTWWQRLLQTVGLYKAPEAPAKQAAGSPAPAAADPKVKSNTRNARGRADDGAERPPKRDREERGERGERRERSDRGGERRERQREPGDVRSVESARLYVGNLSYEVSESDLQDLFKGIGGVRHVEVVYNRATHRSKGYGFVEMLHVDEAKRAVEVLHDQFFMGRRMTVSGAKRRGQDEREEQEEPTRGPANAPAAENPAPAAAQTAPENPAEPAATATPSDPAEATDPSPTEERPPQA